MRTIIVIILALIGGFIAGIVLSEIIGIIGLLAFDGIVGIKFLPVYVAVIAAITAPLVDRRIQGRSG